MKNLIVFFFLTNWFLFNSLNGFSQQSKCGISASDSSICLGSKVNLTVSLPQPDSTNTIAVPIVAPLYSGLASWTYNQDGTLLENYSNTYGLPGMLVFGDSTQMYGGIEATIKQTGAGWYANAGVAMAVTRSSKYEGHPFNGANCYFLSISDGHVSLNNAEIPGEIIGKDIPGLSVVNWNKIKLEILPNAHIYGYVNDVLYIDYTIPGGIVPKGRFALVTANSWNQYKSISSYSFPLEVLWSTGDTTQVIEVYPKKSTVYNVAVKGAFKTCNNFFSIEVKQPATSVLNASICKGEKYRFNNQNLTEEGTYTVSLTSVDGCDSTATLNLKVNESSFYTQFITVCDSFFGPEGNIWTQSGSYIFTLPNKAGCDSIITTELTVLNPVSPILSIVGDTLTCQNSYLSYQWYDELGKIQGKTSNQLIITKSGSYSLSVIDVNGCTLVSNEVTIVYSSAKSIPANTYKIQVFPNPNNGKFSIRTEGIHDKKCQLQFVNSVGQVQLVKNFSNINNSGNSDVDVTELAKGIYYLQFISDKFQHTEKIIIN